LWFCSSLLSFKFGFARDSDLRVILLLELCECNLIKVLLWNCKFVLLWIYCVLEKLLSVCITNWFIRALNQFISLLHLISLAPRFVKVFQIAKTIFKGLNWKKIFQSSIHPPLELSLKHFHNLFCVDHFSFRDEEFSIKREINDSTSMAESIDNINSFIEILLYL